LVRGVGAQATMGAVVAYTACKKIRKIGEPK